MMTPLPQIERLGLIAGEGRLPVQVARTASDAGIPVVTFSVGLNNRKELKKICQGHLHKIAPGLLNRNLALLKDEAITHVVFAGKVNKWILFRNPRLDERAIEALKMYKRKNDDQVMQWIIDQLHAEGIEVVSQTDYLQKHFVPAGLLTKTRPLSEDDQADIRYGFEIAKEMGRLDVGQTIVLKSGMLLAVEAIEGTDECLKRAAQWSRKKGGVVVKVAKPEQDNRFDVPTVGLRTLKVMKRGGLHVLATEADRTLFLEPEEMVDYAERHGIIMVSVSDGALQENIWR